MKSKVCTLLSLLFVLTGFAESASQVNWLDAPDLPLANAESAQIGVAGPFVGTHDGRLIVAGGANFPQGMPWEESKPPKIYHDTIYVMHDGVWQVSKTRLPQALGYGVSISTDKGVVCIGGEWKDPEMHRSAATFLLRWDEATQDVVVESGLPDLPRASTAQAGAMVDGVFYVAGGDTGDGATKDFWSLDPAIPHAAWQTLPPWPGPERVLAVAAAQNDGHGNRFFLFSGRKPMGDSTLFLTDSWSFDPKSATWEQLPDSPSCLMAAPAIASGANHIVIFGGADGKLFQRLAHDLPDALKLAPDAESTAALEAEKLAILTKHPGFRRDILAYHAVTRTWVNIGQIEGASPVTTTAAMLDGEVYIPTGEMSPGIRTPQVLRAKLGTTTSFGTLNYVILFVYLIAMLINGWMFSKKMKSTDDFFKAGGRIPWWAAGLSIFGTQLSAITFIAIPAKTFATDWRYLVGNLSILLVAPFIVFLFLPFYRRLKVTTAYEYLELRFNVTARTIGSCMFMLLQFGRIGVVLLIPSIALSTVTGMNVEMCIVLMGVLCVAYTAMGGMEAVIWTDVVQVVVLLGGAIVALCLMPGEIAGGWNEMVNIAESQDKFRVLDFHLSLSDATFIVLLFGATGGNLISYGTDQAVIQRYLTTPDEKSAARGIWTNAILAVPAALLFFGIGSALFAYYSANPADANVALTKTDAIFPFFIVSSLPAGIAGLVIAAVFAASMSSLDSSMNSVSAAVTTDFYRRFKKEPSEQSCLRVARITTVVVGLTGTGFAIWMANSDVKSLWDQFAKLLGLFGGGLGGLFMLAMFTTKAHGRGAVIGLICSGICQFLLQQNTDIHGWLYGFTGIASCVILGLLASIILPGNGKSTEGLTIYSLKDEA
ncbi:MAG: SSS family solute:Na+ symporter [Rhodothermales bacterium]|jgi:SSS family solute:Na+ symporter